MYINRTAEELMLKTAESFPCLVVYGARQVGKSTTVMHLFGEHFASVTLDDLDDRDLAGRDPRLFLETYGWPLIIGEIQKVPKLLDMIKIKVDEQRLAWMKNNEPRTLMYILTGSNRFELQQGISDSLAGRCGIVDLASFSAMEREQHEAHAFNPDIRILQERARKSDLKYRSRAQIFQDIFMGGMPDVVTGEAERDIYFKSYVSTYIEKDVKKLIAASSEAQFRNFLYITALRTGQELHYDKIAGAVGIDVRTCKRWMSILETAGIVYLLHPYMSNLSNRIIKAPKLYFMDTGLCAYLCKWPDAEMLENGAMGGAFFETYVVSEMVKNLYAFNMDPDMHLFYYRDKDQKEIDLLFVSQDKVWPIEVKKSLTPKNPTRNFSALDKYHFNVQPGLVIDTCEKIRPINERAWYYPVFRLGE
ncbi:MAG: ATP-binding protein [Eubacterium sp.]